MTALRWETDSRYYRVKVQKDLFGGLAVLCIWGGKNTKRGNFKLIQCQDYAELRQTVRKIAKTRKRNGYAFSLKSL